MLLGHERAEDAERVRDAQAREDALKMDAGRPVLDGRLEAKRTKEGGALVNRLDLHWRRVTRRRHEDVARGGDKRRDESAEVVVELQDVEHVHKEREPRAAR